MGADVSFDTTILIYSVSQGDPRSAQAERLLSIGAGSASVSSNECASVARRKLGFSWQEIDLALAAIRVLCRPARPLTVETHQAASELAASDNVNF